MRQAPTTDHPAAFIGFGEAGEAIASGWLAEEGVDAGAVRAYDIKTDSDDAAIAEGKRADYARVGIIGCDSAADALSGAALVFSTVTADQARIVAEGAAANIAKGALYFDCNSCSPGAKRKAAEAIEAAGGRYVDTAVVAPVYPKRHKAPMLISGPHAEAGLEALSSLGMSATIVEGAVGAASSIKMIRSVMMKGLEALFLECVLSGRRAGVDEVVLASLDDTFPDFGFARRAAYMLERSATHGLRRAAEMREVAVTVDELGLTGRMARATVDWQQQIGDLKIKADFGTDGEGDYQALADALIAKLISREDAA
ncbi:DUF1932 domain-containing protein [Rhodobium gokarnense]|uniref:3-hydroxyisobutyrate dehydrogenase-like beta-hydroxyacid dehydrogenase n=1 Tax=Rhodobium gokarnense TaxID=364296 RepID=A0ABT3HAV6_9HYPH|nr:NAD(P)-dependent oxidoreductase [Rhodobium gokarnense]MCW2307515.1 3-hydroxyisobutyrate dehydrogenase-like beta-hydroxyacid dehydrogenase [Rhodobium gokarnense]